MRRSGSGISSIGGRAPCSWRKQFASAERSLLTRWIDQGCAWIGSSLRDSSARRGQRLSHARNRKAASPRVKLRDLPVRGPWWRRFQR